MENHTEVEDQHPLKQGLKHLQKHSAQGQSQKVEDQHPLKQGLKQVYMRVDILFQSWCRRPTSTKTRIETIGQNLQQTATNQVEDQHPLKQGLKPQKACEGVKKWQRSKTNIH